LSRRPARPPTRQRITAEMSRSRADLLIKRSPRPIKFGISREMKQPASILDKPWRNGMKARCMANFEQDPDDDSSHDDSVVHVDDIDQRSDSANIGNRRRTSRNYRFSMPFQVPGKYKARHVAWKNQSSQYANDQLKTLASTVIEMAYGEVEGDQAVTRAAIRALLLAAKRTLASLHTPTKVRSHRYGGAETPNIVPTVSTIQSIYASNYFLSTLPSFFALSSLLLSLLPPH
jgi:hypothetical protein